MSEHACMRSEKERSMSTIDTSNLTAMYSEYASQIAKESATSGLKSVAKADYSKATDDELMDACKQFESYFLEQVFKQMTKSVNFLGTPEGTSSSQLMDFFKENTIQELAKQSTETNSLGLAQMLYEQMKRNIEGSDIPPAEEKKAVEEIKETEG